jgi:hypothetical protein
MTNLIAMISDPAGSTVRSPRTRALRWAREGYWVKVSEDGKLIYDGNFLDLTAGWNLIGWR